MKKTTETKLVESERVEVFYDAKMLLKSLCYYYWGTENVLGVKIDGHKVIVRLKDETEHVC